MGCSGTARRARTGLMSSSSTVYVNDAAALEAFQRNLKLRACPACAQTGFLNSHGPWFGYGGHRSERHKRGHRVFCSNRFRKRGCGKTFSVLFSLLLKGRIIPAALVTAFLAPVLAGACRHAAWLSVAHGFSLESGYRLWRDWVLASCVVPATFALPPCSKPSVTIPKPSSCPTSTASCSSPTGGAKPISCTPR